MFCSHLDWFTLDTRNIVLNQLFGRQTDDTDIVLFPQRATNKKVQYTGPGKEKSEKSLPCRMTSPSLSSEICIRIP